jgi:nicotinate-nucleotide adenylyltransferase
MASARQRADTPLKRPAITTGLLGGSFNPAHGGHLGITRHAMAALGLDEVWWLVSPGNPLKPAAGMAPLAARFASAKRQSRHHPIRATAIERELHTRFTVDTLAAITRRWPKRRFIWLMGADNLAQLHRWHQWRKLACIMPIAVLARPGYDARALASPAMVWLRKYQCSAANLRNRPKDQNLNGHHLRSVPQLVLLRFDPDPRSASTLRLADPEWFCKIPSTHLRDAVTFRPLKKAISSQ